MAGKNAPAFGVANTVFVAIDFDVGGLDPDVGFVLGAVTWEVALNWRVIFDEAFALGSIVLGEGDQLVIGAHLNLNAIGVLIWGLVALAEFQFEGSATQWVLVGHDRRGAGVI